MALYLMAEDRVPEARVAVYDAACRAGIVPDDGPEELTADLMGRVAYWLGERMKVKASHTPESVALNTAWSHLLRLGDGEAWEAEESARDDVFGEVGA